MSLYKDCTYERFSPECENPITEKTLTVNMCGHIFTVSVGPESEIDDSIVCCSGLYDMYDAAKHFISSEDIIERDNPLRHTDFIPRPEISDFAIPLSEKQVEKRISFLTDCYRLLKDKKVLEAIVDFIPKNKDGRFLENSRTIIATSGMVSPTCSMFAIEAYTKSKLEISINVSWVDFSGDLKQGLVNCCI